MTSPTAPEENGPVAANAALGLVQLETMQPPFTKALSLALALSAAACHPFGQRLCTLEVAREGRVVFDSMFDVSDGKGLGAIWDEAGEVPVSTNLASPEAFSFPEPTRAHLDGEVAVRILHSDVLDEVTLESLDLVRSDGDAADWRLPREEILRAKAAAGL